jgi:phosphoribosyl 1,2-cyclic phosphodiesterase
VELQVGGHTIILDAGTGIINLGYDLLRRAEENDDEPIIATILLTHLHHDHTHGFPFFAPFLKRNSILHILGPHTFQQKLEDELSNVVLTPNFPLNMQEMPSFKIIHTINNTERVILGSHPADLHIHNIYHDHREYSPDDVRILIHKGYAHPKNGVYIYRVEWRDKSVVFASDTEGYVGTDQRLVQFARNTDVLIHDAQYTHEVYTNGRQGWGHSTIEMACEVAKQSDTKQLVLFHHDPAHADEVIDDMEQRAKTLFSNVIAAYEGLEIVLI